PDGMPVCITVADGEIRSIKSLSEPFDSQDEQRWILPGFFDLQVNGFAGRSFADPSLTADDVEHIARAVLATGVTRFLPTIVTADLDVMCAQLATISNAMRDLPLVGEMCPRIHLEGPFINPEDGPRGAHRREFVREPSIADFERLWAASQGRIAILTLAPDQPGAFELIRHVSGRSVVVALGHHRARGEMLDAAIRAGAKISTHLGNGADAVL